MSLEYTPKDRGEADSQISGFYELRVQDAPALISSLTGGKPALLDALSGLPDRIAFVPHGVGRGFLPSVYLLNDPRDVADIWVGHQDDLDKTGLFYEATRRFAGEGLFTMQSGDRWKAHQRLIGPHVIPHRIDRLSDMVADVVKRSFPQDTGNGAVTIPDLHARIKTISFQITAQTLLGYDATDAEALRIAEALTMLNRFVAHSSQLGGIPERGYRAMPAAYPRIFRAERTLHGFADTIQQCAHSALLTSLREAGEQAGVGLTKQDIHDEIITVLAAGHGTTASAITWSLYFLGLPQHGHYQKEVRQDTALDYRKMAATRMVKESMRLYPPVYITSRQTVRPVGGGDASRGEFHIRTGAHVVISPYILHRNPAYWDSPDEFLPDRFTGANSPAYMPFGIGERKCIGEHFALSVSADVLGYLLRRYEVRSVSQAKPLFLSTLRPQKAMQLEFKPV